MHNERDDIREADAQADVEDGAEDRARSGAAAKREWVRATILSGMTLGAVIVVSSGGPTTVASISHF